MSNSENNKSKNGILILILGILSIVLFPPLGIAVWIMGQQEKKLHPNDSLVSAGLIFGITGTIILIIVVFLLVIFSILVAFIVYKKLAI